MGDTINAITNAIEVLGFERAFAALIVLAIVVHYLRSNKISVKSKTPTQIAPVCAATECEFNPATQELLIRRVADELRKEVLDAIRASHHNEL
jgi:hypothetical protein